MPVFETSHNPLPAFWHVVRDDQLAQSKYRQEISGLRKKIAAQIAQSLVEMSEPHPALVSFLEKILVSAPIKIFSDGDTPIIRFDDPHARLPGRLFDEELSYGLQNGYVPLVDKQGREHILVKYDGKNEEEATQTAKLLTTPTQQQLVDGGILGQRILFIAIQKDNDLAARAAQIDTPLPSKGDLTRSLRHFLLREADLAQQCLDAENAALDHISRTEARLARKARIRPSVKKEGKEKKPKIGKSNADLLHAIEQEMVLQSAKIEAEQKTKSARHRWEHEKRVTKKLEDAVGKLVANRASYNKIRDKREQLDRARQRVLATRQAWQSQQKDWEMFHAKYLQMRLQKPAAMALPLSVRQLFSLQAAVDCLRDEEQRQKMAIRAHTKKIARYKETIEDLTQRGEIKDRNKTLHSQSKTQKTLQYARKAAQEITWRVQQAETRLQNHIEMNSLGHIHSRAPDYMRTGITKRYFSPPKTRGVPVQTGRVRATAPKP